MKLYNLDQISEMLDISRIAVFRRFETLNIKRMKREGNYSVYSLSQIKAISKDNGIDGIKYYPLKTTVIYEVYPSKINKL